MENITIKCEKCKNRFMIENVTGIYLCTVCDCKNEHYVFPNSFTNDEIIKALFSVNTNFEQNLVYGFLLKSNYMDHDQLEALVQKVEDIVKDGENISDISLNNNLYNEALIFVTSGINNNECKSVKDDFESKFKIYREKQIQNNENIIKLMNDLHNKLISIKVK